MKQNRFLSKILGATVLTLVGSSLCLADSKSMLESDLALSQQTSNIEVKADGSYKAKIEDQFFVQNEAGKQKVALTKIPFVPGYSKIKVISASTLTHGVSHPLDLSTIEDREVGGQQNGISSARQLILPFTDLDIHSMVNYAYEEEVVKPKIPGVFSQVMAYGLTFPEMKGLVHIRSEKPLFYKVEQIGHEIEVTPGRQGNFYTLDIKLVSPAYHELKSEPLSILKKGMFPRVDVTTAESWNQLASFLANKYNAEIDKKLPDEFLAIQKEAEKLKSPDEKIDFVVNSIMSKITYVGYWTSIKGMFYPRGHHDVATSKTGDCKDFSTSVAGILRKLGIKANVALVNSGAPYDTPIRYPASDDKGFLPILDLFNHAIVRVEVPGQPARWVDPTQLANYPGGIYPQIAAAHALTLSSETKDLETIPADPVPAISEIVRNIQVSADGTAQETATFTDRGAPGVNDKIILRAMGQPALEARILKGALKERKEISNSSIVLDFNKPGYSTGTTVLTTVSGLNKDELFYHLGYDIQWQTLALASKTRVSDLYLGVVGHTTVDTTLRGLVGKDNAASDCFVLSPWVELRRSVKLVKDGVAVHDDYFQKKTSVTSKEMRSHEFASLLSEIGRCLQNGGVYLQGPTGIAKKKFIEEEWPDIAKATVDDAEGLLRKSGPDYVARSMTARRIAERALEANPKDATARIWLATAISTLGGSGGDKNLYYTEMAMIEANRAVADAPKLPLVYEKRALFAIALGDRTQALRDFAISYAAAPEDPRNFQVGAALAKDAKDAAGEENWLLGYARVAKLPDDQRLAQSALGAFYYENGKYAKAIEFYQAAIKIDPKNAWLHNDLGIAIGKFPERLEEAIATERTALELADIGAARQNLARYLGEKAKHKFDAFKEKDSKALEPDKERIVEFLIVEALKYDNDSVVNLDYAGRFFQLKGEKYGSRDTFIRSADYYGRALKLNAKDSTALDGVYALNGKGIPTVPLDKYPRMPASEQLHDPAAVPPAMPHGGAADKPHEAEKAK